MGEVFGSEEALSVGPPGGAPEVTTTSTAAASVSTTDNTMFDELKTIPAGDFEAVDTSSLMLDPNSGAAR